MQLNLDKTVILVAATKAIAEVKWGYDMEQLQRIVDLLSTKNARFIQSVTLKPYDYELIEPYLEDV